MSLKLREINNAGTPLVDSAGTVLTGVAVSFTLTSKFGKAMDAWDAVTGTRVASATTTVLTSTGIAPDTLPAGEFAVSLWPTSRSSSKVYYKVVVDHPQVKDFVASLDEGTVPVAWSEVKHGSYDVTAVEVSEFAAHVQNPLLHNPAIESANATAMALVATTKAAEAAASASSMDNSVLVTTTKAAEAVVSAGTAAAQAAAAVITRGQVDVIKAAVSASEVTVEADRVIVADDKATVAADKAIVIAAMNTVAYDKASVIADMNTVAADKATVAADVVRTMADRVQTGIDVLTTRASATTAVAQAVIATSKADQVTAAALGLQANTDASVFNLANNLIITQTIMVTHIAFN